MLALTMALLGCSQEIGVRSDDSGCEDADGDLYCSFQDCDDDDALAYPGGPDTWYDGIDGDCDGADDYDADGDGDASDQHGGGDCDDTDPAIGPSADEVWYDGEDADCDGASDYDADADGHDAAEHGGDDCDDQEPLANPGQSEIWYDGIDNDCGGDNDLDADGDTFDSSAHGGTDCDDADAAVNPDATETWDDGVDQDCDGADQVDADGDADGYEAKNDCDDSDASIHPGADDTWYDGIDSDCAGDDDYDADLDGFQHAGYGGEDCNDYDASVNPDAIEVWYDGIDADCDGANDYDADADGYENESWGNDCADDDAGINPGATDTWYDGVDTDCDGADDYDADADGYQSDSYGGDDCDDTDSGVSPAETLETLDDGVDTDCDGYDASGPWSSIDVQLSTDVTTVGVVETDVGVLVHFFAEDVMNTGDAGALWTFYDAATPWSGASSSSSWTFNTTVPFSATDVAADGNYLIEAYTVLGSAANYLYVDTTNVISGSYNSLYFVLPPATTTLEDVNVSYDGATWHVVGCEGSFVDNLSYLTGTTDELFTAVGYDSLQSQGEGGDRCAVDPSNGVLRVSNQGDNEVTLYAQNGTSFDVNSSFSSYYNDVEYSWDGSNVLFTYANYAAVIADDDTDSDTAYTSTTVDRLQVASDGTTVFAAFVDTSGDAWLMYGALSTGLTEIPLDTGLATVEDIDVVATSSGALVVVAQGGDAVRLMTIAL